MAKSKIFLTKKTIAIRAGKHTCSFVQNERNYTCDFFDSINNMCILYNVGIKLNRSKKDFLRCKECKKEFAEVE